jgi:hypothetical protein
VGEAVPVGLRRCLFCADEIRGRAHSAKYCSESHRQEASRRRKRYADTEVTHGRGEKLTPMRRQLLPLYMRVAAGKLSLEQVALAAVEPEFKVAKDYTAWRGAVDEFNKVGDWQQDDRIGWMLGHDLERPDFRDIAACGVWATEMVERFMAFEAEFFRVASRKKFLRVDGHYEWISATLATYASGGYLQILSPPRHGKSELLVHFAVWMICVNFNIRILWVGPSEEIAKSMLIAVRTYLEDSDALISGVLGPGRSFQPTTALGRDWSSSSFTVAVRDVTLVGSTMLAVGRGAKILSRNADVIVCDDIEDKASTNQPKMRQDTKDWFGTDLDSRKEEHTGLIVIGSRQHLDDLYAANLDDENFYCITNAAHDPGCVLDPHDVKAHTKCMFFPELRSYKWLMTKKAGAVARGNPGLFEMVYQNNPQGEGMASFDEHAVLASRNPSRSYGIEGIPSGFKLIAGLDPSATGYQSGFLWAVRQRADLPDVGEGVRRFEDVRLQRWMVDMDNTLGGGIPKAHELMKRWLEEYGVRVWVVEINGFQRAILQDPVLVNWARENGVKLIPHQTGLNKIDEVYGVTAMDRLFQAGLMDLPYGDDVSKSKTDMYVKQLLTFDDSSARKKYKPVSDIVMSSWFPTEEIRRMERQLRTEQSPPTRGRGDGYTKSYQNVTSLTRGRGGRTVPWRHKR